MGTRKPKSNEKSATEPRASARRLRRELQEQSAAAASEYESAKGAALATIDVMTRRWQAADSDYPAKERQIIAYLKHPAVRRVLGSIAPDLWPGLVQAQLETIPGAGPAVPPPLH